MTVEELLVFRKSPLDEKQTKLIFEAFEFAKEKHKKQKRKSGEDYFEHCIETAKTVLKMGLGAKTTAAALLHDVYEDTDCTLEEIQKRFGKEVAFIVDGVTKVGKVRLKGSTEEIYLENLRKMFLAMAADVRVVLIKIADRLHNMKTLYALPAEKQYRIAKETMEIFVPIANRLGIGEIKGQLEDLAFKYLDPKNYAKTVQLENEAYEDRKRYVNRAIQELKSELKKEKIRVIDIHGRAKYYYRFFEKLQKHNMNIEKIYDLVAIRIIVPELADCYETLGIVHKKYNPLVGRIKDYIALPKPNGYRSIHTTVFGPEGKILEVQIRTKRMHDEAEFGIAAHWIYSEGKNWRKYIFKKNVANIPEKELQWLSQLKDWHTETGGKNDEFWASLKIDFFKNHIFAFTPKGDVIDLPENSTPVDFAYRIHSEIGNRLIGAKINGRIMALDSTIRNGDLVEIITTKQNKLPNRDWLLFVKTANARSKIKNALKKKKLGLFKF